MLGLHKVQTFLFCNLRFFCCLLCFALSYGPSDVSLLFPELGLPIIQVGWCFGSSVQNCKIHVILNLGSLSFMLLLIGIKVNFTGYLMFFDVFFFHICELVFGVDTEFWCER